MVHRGTLAFVLRDAFPVTEGHCLIVPIRHVADWNEASEEERAELIALIDPTCAWIHQLAPADGFNIGMNLGAAAGQTIPHLHLHVIPRRHGDMADPRGGVRHVIPDRGNYLSGRYGAGSPAGGGAVLVAEEPRPGGVLIADQDRVLMPAPALHPGERLPARTGRADAATTPSPVLSTGGDDPLLPLLEADLVDARQVDIAVAFVMPSGVQRLYPHFEDLLSRRGNLRLLTGDYLGVTDPDALERLLDLQALHGLERCQLRVFEAQGRSFHPKAYLLSRGAPGGIAYVGSSNLSESALTDGIEWNYRLSADRDPAGWQRIEGAFQALFHHPSTRALDHPWLQAYRLRRPALLARPGTGDGARRKLEDAAAEPPPAAAQPHAIQLEALAALARTRQDGYRAGLVVLATGLGKTWLSAFDARAVGARRLLFVAHRQEILAQAMETYRRIFPAASIGIYDGQTRDVDSDILFASIQTLGRERHLGRFDRQAFDYVVIDEFHHASATTYTRLINHFEPAFLLGLTATPERLDGGDLMTLCQENLLYRCGIPEGIRRDLLCAYRYFGVPDQVDYRNIPWRSNRFDEAALTQAVATQARAANVLAQWRKRGGTRTLAFCVCQRHADFMRGYFAERGIATAAVHAGPASAARAQALEQLRDGVLQIIFAVDMFNEGVDVPAIDTVMMLRPTESPIVWLQQFGRGLRKLGDKTLTVIDYIGNHRSFLMKARTLMALTAPGDRALIAALKLAEKGGLDLPPGCEVTYELEALDIMRALLRGDASETDALERYYLDFRERTGRRPTAAEAFHDGYLPRTARVVHGSWLGLVREKGDLDEATWAGLAPARSFLDSLETTRMTRGYKMLVLLAMLNRDALPGPGIGVEELAEAFRRIASRSPRLAAELGAVAEESEAGTVALLEKQPIAAWTGDVATAGGAVFRYSDRTLRFVPMVAAEMREVLQGLVRELADWRLAEYLARPANDEQGGVAMLKVSHANGRPILFLPTGEARSGLPDGWTPVDIDGKAHEANFVKIAINVVRETGRTENVLPGILRGWFGPDAGLPGTQYSVECRESEGRWVLAPVGRAAGGDGPEIHRRYSREQIPGLFGETFSPANWNAGFVVITPKAPKHIVLMVTLDKRGMSEAFQYGDRFLDAEHFQWQSQNRTGRDGKVGQLIQNHAARGVQVHLFVRAGKRRQGGAAGFVYCGLLVFEGWEGDRPVTVRWRLGQSLSGRVATESGISD